MPALRYMVASVVMLTIESTPPLPVPVRMVWPLVAIRSGGDSTWGKSFSFEISLSPQFESHTVWGVFFCLDSNEIHEFWLRSKQSLLNLLLTQFNDEQWHFNASKSVELFFFLSIFFSYVCDLWRLALPCSPLPISGHEQMSLLESVTIESLHFPTRWKDFIFPYD